MARTYSERIELPNVAGIDSGRLRNLVGQIEAAEARKHEAGEDAKDIYDIAKSQGFDVKILRRIVKERRRKKIEVEREELVLETYRRALAGWDSTPLASFAKAAE